jgi:hypothetical protein
MLPPKLGGRRRIAMTVSALLVHLVLGTAPAVGSAPADHQPRPPVATTVDDGDDEAGTDTPLVAAPVDIVRVFTAARVEIVQVPMHRTPERLVAAPVEIVRIRATVAVAVAPAAPVQDATDDVPVVE